MIGCTSAPVAPAVTQLASAVAAGTLVRFGEKAKLACPVGLRFDTGERRRGRDREMHPWSTPIAKAFVPTADFTTPTNNVPLINFK